ncbi:MAG: hypothetical protein ACSLE1_06980 [Sphingobium sp.]
MEACDDIAYSVQRAAACGGRLHQELTEILDIAFPAPGPAAGRLFHLEREIEHAQPEEAMERLILQARANADRLYLQMPLRAQSCVFRVKPLRPRWPGVPQKALQVGRLALSRDFGQIRRGRRIMRQIMGANDAVRMGHLQRFPAVGEQTEWCGIGFARDFGCGDERVEGDLTAILGPLDLIGVKATRPGNLHIVEATGVGIEQPKPFEVAIKKRIAHQPCSYAVLGRQIAERATLPSAGATARARGHALGPEDGLDITDRRWLGRGTHYQNARNEWTAYTQHGGCAMGLKNSLIVFRIVS